MKLFVHPELLWLLIFLLGPLCVFLFLTWRSKQKLIAQFVQARLLSNLTINVSQGRQKLRLVLLATAVAFLILVLARPQWGFSLEEAKQQGLDIIVAIDTSRSMLASDVAPNRLTRAKLAALDLMKLARNDRLGLVAFAGSAFLQCPLTLDEEAFRESVNSLDVGIIPQGGTALTEAIQTAQTAFEKGTDNHRVLILFTDGEDHDTGAKDEAEKAAKDGMKIFTVGVGTSEGELIRITDEQGNAGFLKDDSGNAVKSRLDETLLRQIATTAHGSYLPLQGAKPMEVLYAQGLAPLPKTDSTTKLVRRAREQYQWPLGMAIFLLLLELFLPRRRKLRRTENHATLDNTMETVSVLIALLAVSSPAAHASPSSALREYESGNYHTALEEFQKLTKEKTNDLRLSYNAGTAAYKAKQYEDAQKFFNTATASPDLKLQQQAYYNLGNTLFESGAQAQEPEKKQKSWEDSLQNFQNSLKLNSQDDEAKNNVEFVKKKLEELKQQQKQQKKDDSSKDKDKDDQKQDQQQDKNSEQNKDSEKKQDQQQKQDSTKQEQDKNKKDEQKKDAEKKQQAKDEQQKKDQQQQSQNAKDKPEDQSAEEQEAQAMAAGQMTPEQARQFLDAQKQEDKPLIFAPAKKPENANRIFKDW